MKPAATILFTRVTPCPAKYQWCVHIVWIRCIPCFCRSLVTPSCSCAQIAKSSSRVISIHLGGSNVCDEDESDKIVAEQITGGKSSLSRSRFQAIFPGFISKSSGVENSILKEKWWGGGESWMKKEGGLRGYNPTTSKKASLSPFPASFAFLISSTIADEVRNQRGSWWRCRGFGRRWAKCC